MELDVVEEYEQRIASAEGERDDAWALAEERARRVSVVTAERNAALADVDRLTRELARALHALPTDPDPCPVDEETLGRYAAQGGSLGGVAWCIRRLRALESKGSTLLEGDAAFIPKVGPFITEDDGARRAYYNDKRGNINRLAAEVFGENWYVHRDHGAGYFMRGERGGEETALNVLREKRLL